MSDDNFFGDVIHSYSRAQAIADSVLVDVSATAREAGIKFPVALTSAVWAQYVQVPPGIIGQDEAGRLWDIVWMLRCSIKKARSPGREIRFTLYVRNTNTDHLTKKHLVTLKALCSPGDQNDRVITVMLPEED